MAGTNDDFGKSVHCRELSSGQYYTGILTLSDVEFVVDLIAYEARSLKIDCDAPIHLQTQNQNIVSLFSNYSALRGTVHAPADDSRRKGLYRDRIVSRIAVIGSGPWQETDIVKSATFNISSIDFMLRHAGKVESISSSDIYSEADRNIFEVTVDDLTVRADYSSSYSFDAPYPIKTFASLGLVFHKERSIQNYIEDVLSVVQLFAASAGVSLLPEEINISRTSMFEIESGSPDADYVPAHGVRYLWPEVAVDKTLVWAGASFLLSSNDEEVEALKACLSTWLSRRSAWRNANDLLMGCLALSNEGGPSRFLNACRWFEEIPGATATQAIASSHVDAIAEVASAKAVELGHGAIAGRVAGLIKRISEETQRARLQRLLLTVQKRFGAGVLQDSVVEDLLRAMKLRGKAAHGHLRYESNHDYGVFARSMLALEAFCFLLTVRDLPMSNDGLKRAGANPIVQRYRHCAVG
ncbi:MAG: hypothetical protein Q7T81_06895 [Pseudolabrys sp.]|nr:hypothetical protein [Pseudolabrys sp.]